MAVIIPSLSNAVFVDTVEAIQRVLMPAGYEMMIGVSHYRPEDERLLRAYLAHQPAGLLLTGFERSEAARAVLASYTAPRVTLMELSDQADSYCVGFAIAGRRGDDPHAARARLSSRCVRRGAAGPAHPAARRRLSPGNARGRAL